MFLTNSFEGLEEDIEECDCEQYSAVIMFGLDTKLKDRIRIDVRAQTEFGTKDTVWDVSAISEMFDICGVPNYISKRPTKYLCNYAYYLMLKKCADGQFLYTFRRKDILLMKSDKILCL